MFTPVSSADGRGLFAVAGAEVEAMIERLIIGVVFAAMADLA
jgi:hypothetical protein